MISNVRAVFRDQAVDRWLDAQERETQDDKPGHPLDSQTNQKLHGRLLEWYDNEMQKQAPNRYQMAIDHDFYDGLQWSDEDAAEIMSRGQAPVVYNDVKPALDWVIGAEKRMRVDWAVLPRTEDDVEMADVKKKVLKYVSDVNKVPYKRSEAFAEALKGGLSWLEDGAKSVPGEEPIYSRWESWRYVLYDSNDKERDLSASRYIFRWKYVDLDIAEAMFKDRKGILRQSAIDSQLIGGDEDDEMWFLGQRVKSDDMVGTSHVGRRTFISDAGWVNTRRQRVKLIEAWYRIPVECEYFSEGEFAGQEFDKKNPAMVAAAKAGEPTYRATKMKIRVAIMTRKGLLQDMESPYKHGRFGLTPIWCYRRGRDNAPYGMIRNLRDVQESRNKRMSKALFVMSTNQLVGDEDAFRDWNEAREEANRPDGVLAHKKGANFDIRRDYNEVKGLMEYAEFDSHQIQKSSGVTDENLGRETNAKSGIAIERRQDQGAMVTAEVFDNYRLAYQISGQNQLSLIEQYMSEPKVIRLTGYKGRLEWVRINQPEVMPDGRVHYLNDITASQADFVVDEQDFTATMRQALFDSMMAMVSRLPPELAIQMLDMVVEMVDFPGREELVNRIRKLNGQSDPSKKEDPETLEREAAAEEAAAQQAALALEALQLENAEKAATVEKLNAEIEKIRAEAASGGEGDGGEADARIRELEEQVRTELNSMQAAFDKTVEDLRRKADDAAAKRETELERTRVEAGSKEEQARIQADATVEAARISAASQSAMQPLLDEIEGLRARLEEMRTQHEEQEKARKEAEKEAKARKANEAGGNDGEQAKPIAMPQIVVQVGGQSKTFEIKKSKDGSFVGRVIPHQEELPLGDGDKGGRKK